MYSVLIVPVSCLAKTLRTVRLAFFRHWKNNQRALNKHLRSEMSVQFKRPSLSLFLTHFHTHAHEHTRTRTRPHAHAHTHANARHSRKLPCIHLKSKSGNFNVYFVSSFHSIWAQDTSDTLFAFPGPLSSLKTFKICLSSKSFWGRSRAKINT